MEILTWMDVETLKLLFGMMVLVSILSETGFFHYIAVQTYRLARGQIWTLVTSLCLVTAILSAFLDNVTTILLMSAVAIKLCETMNIDPRRMLIAMVVFSNIGGAMTPIGDPPNIIIINNRKVQIAGIGFIDFTIHMAPAVILCIAATYLFLRLMYRDISALRLSDPPEVIVSKHEIDVWKTALNSLTGYSKEDDTARAEVHRKITLLETSMKKKIDNTKISEEEFRASLLELTNAITSTRFPDDNIVGKQADLAPSGDNFFNTTHEQGEESGTQNSSLRLSLTQLESFGYGTIKFYPGCPVAQEIIKPTQCPIADRIRI
ncbi:p protein [Trichonephila clavipes]|uniref:P protein n=1 Tax=Trichonephila clavipes TaxID=2585209 RepID=A0A8X6RH24_TRICX|nr:p protein [Trichonephila clavipes]